MNLQADCRKATKALSTLKWLDENGKPDVWKTHENRDSMYLEDLIWAMLKCGTKSIPFPAYRISTYRYTHDFRSPNKQPKVDECAVVIIGAPRKFATSTDSFIVTTKSTIPFCGKGVESAQNERWCPKMMGLLKSVSIC